jgi:hypothetical protein
MNKIIEAISQNFLKIMSVLLGVAVLWFIVYFCCKGIFCDEGKIEVETSLGDKYEID